MKENGLYSAREVAELLGVGNKTVANWCRKNNIPKAGGMFILTKKDIQKFKNRPNKVGRPSKLRSY